MTLPGKIRTILSHALISFLLVYAASTAPAMVAIPPTIMVNNSDYVIFAI